MRCHPVAYEEFCAKKDLQKMKLKKIKKENINGNESDGKTILESVKNTNKLTEMNISKREVQVISEDESDDDNDMKSSRIDPITDGSEITFSVNTLNKFLVCPICRGYFRDAHTINSCLHTFCFVCLDKNFSSSTKMSCPRCHDFLAPNPMKNVVRPDPVMQNIVDKIFPRKINEIGKSELKQKNSPENSNYIPHNPKRDITFEFQNVCSDIKEYKENEGLPKLNNLDRPFIRTSYNVTIKVLKKYLVLKLNDIKSIDDIEITCNNESLGNEWNLEFIRKTRWQDYSSDMILGYRKRTNLK